MNKRKWSNEAHAWADGWGIEFIWRDEWEPCGDLMSPSFSPQNEYRIVPDAEGWLPWYGNGDAPISGDTLIEFVVNNSSSDATQTFVKDLNFDCGYLFKYRVVKEEPKPEPPKKKITMQCWKVGTYLQWHLATENKEPFIKCGWIRVPSEDKVIEI